MCLYPKLIRNKKYKSNKKNGGVIPHCADERLLYVPVKCGNCMECCKQKEREWRVRLQEEIRDTENLTPRFVTFTFSNESLNQLDDDVLSKGNRTLSGYNLDNASAKLGVRRFLERWRKKFKKSVKHWLVTEIGGNNTERIHIHGILFTNESIETIDEIWKYGHTWIGEYVSEKTINYIVKYISKTDEKHKEYKSIILTSAGIGKGYTKRKDSKNNKYREKSTNETYRTRDGQRFALPIYYRNKIYTEEEREKLWLEKLDEKTIYVNGIKIDVSENYDEYLAVLKEQQQLNKQLGYKDDSINTERKAYENELRNLKRMQRIIDKENKRNASLG